jgi:hypothetical protein
VPGGPGPTSVAAGRPTGGAKDAAGIVKITVGVVKIAIGTVSTATGIETDAKSPEIATGNTIVVTGDGNGSRTAMRKRYRTSGNASDLSASIVQTLYK